MAPSRAGEGTGRDGPIGHPAHLPPSPRTMESGLRAAPGTNSLGPPGWSSDARSELRQQLASTSGRSTVDHLGEYAP